MRGVNGPGVNGTADDRGWNGYTLRSSLTRSIESVVVFWGPLGYLWGSWSRSAQRAAREGAACGCAGACLAVPPARPCARQSACVRTLEARGGWWVRPALPKSGGAGPVVPT